MIPIIIVTGFLPARAPKSKTPLQVFLPGCFYIGSVEILQFYKGALAN